MKKIALFLLLIVFSIVESIATRFVEIVESAGPAKFVRRVIGAVSRGFARRDMLRVRTSC